MNIHYIPLNRVGMVSLPAGRFHLAKKNKIYR